MEGYGYTSKIVLKKILYSNHPYFGRPLAFHKVRLSAQSYTSDSVPDKVNNHAEHVVVKYDGAVLNTACTKTKKKLGIVLDSNLIFMEHIQDKTKAGFVAWRDIDSLTVGNKDCSQSLQMGLYQPPVRPVIEFGAPVISSSLAECSKEFWKNRRCAMFKAS